MRQSRPPSPYCRHRRACLSKLEGHGLLLICLPSAIVPSPTPTAKSRHAGATAIQLCAAPYDAPDGLQSATNGSTIWHAHALRVAGRVGVAGRHVGRQWLPGIQHGRPVTSWINVANVAATGPHQIGRVHAEAESAVAGAAKSNDCSEQHGIADEPAVCAADAKQYAASDAAGATKNVAYG